MADHHDGLASPKPHHAHHHSLRKTGRRLKHLLHPDGRKVHIAQNPAEAEELRRTLCDAKEDEVEIFIHGSEEHLDALRSIREHHSERRAELQQKYGHIFEQAEAVALELEALSEEMHQVTDRSVQFDANFARFGYSAALRTHGSTGQPHSSSVSVASGKTGQQAVDDFHALKFQGQAMKFWRKPIVRQYFHQGLMWRAEEEEQTASYELFLDLVYVGIIAISGDNAAEEANGQALLRFSITFIQGWKVWFDLVTLMNWFDQDDIWRRLYVLLQIACLVGFTANISQYESTTYTPLVAWYLVSRFATTMNFIWYAWVVPMVRSVMLVNALAAAIPCALWIGSIHVEEPHRLALIWIAVILDSLNFVILMIVRSTLQQSKRFKERFQKAFTFVPANNIEHRIDRTGAFVTLVLGYSVVSLLYSSSSRIGFNAFLGKAILGLIQAFMLNTLYFEVDSFNLHMHAIRRHTFSALSWQTLHLPMILSFVLAGAALARIVLTDDVEGTSSDDLAETSHLKSEAHIEPGLRWFYTAGLGIGMLCLNGIAHTHVYRNISLAPGARFPFIFKRPVRLAYRTLVGLALVFLGFAEGLNSLQLISITCGLIVSAGTVELVGNVITGCTRHLKRRNSNLSGTTIDSTGEQHHKVGLRDWWRAMKEEACRDGKCHYRARMVDANAAGTVVQRATTIKVEEVDREKGGVDGKS